MPRLLLPSASALVLGLALLLPAPARAGSAPLGGFAPMLQYGAGTLGGVAGAVAGGFLGLALEGCRDRGEDDSSPYSCGTAGVLLGGSLGYSAGTVAGVSLVGKAAYGQGHWVPAFMGNVFGAALAFLIASQVPDHGMYALGSSQLVTVIALTPAFTTLGYHAGRRLSLRVGARPDGASLRLQAAF